MRDVRGGRGLHGGMGVGMEGLVDKPAAVIFTAWEGVMYEVYCLKRNNIAFSRRGHRLMRIRIRRRTRE